MQQSGRQDPDSQTWQKTGSFCQCEGQVEVELGDTPREATLHCHPKLAGKLHFRLRHFRQMLVIKINKECKFCLTSLRFTLTYKILQVDNGGFHGLCRRNIQSLVDKRFYLSQFQYLQVYISHCKFCLWNTFIYYLNVKIIIL